MEACTMPLPRSSPQVTVHGLRSTAIERGSLHVELSLHEPLFTTARERRTTSRRTWLQGFRWHGQESFTWKFDVRSLDARLVVRVYHRLPSMRLRRDKCLGSLALRLNSVRHLCEPVGGQTGSETERRDDWGDNENVFHSPQRWYLLRPRSKRREALQAEEQQGLDEMRSDAQQR